MVARGDGYALLRTSLVVVGGVLVAVGLTVWSSWTPVWVVTIELSSVGAALVATGLAVPGAATRPLVPDVGLSADHRRYLLAGSILAVLSWTTLTVAGLILWGLVAVNRLQSKLDVRHSGVVTIDPRALTNRPVRIDGVVRATRVLVGAVAALGVVWSVLLSLWLGAAITPDPEFTPEGGLAVLTGFVVLVLVFFVGIGLFVLAAAVPGPGQRLFVGPPVAERRMALAGALLLIVGGPVDVIATLSWDGSAFLLLGVVLVIVGSLMRAGTFLHRRRCGNDPQR